MENLADAESMISTRAGRILARSRDHWTQPWGFSDERLFLNRALIVETALEPLDLMRALLGIEADLGRDRARGSRYHSRTIDIDVLLIGERIIRLAELRTPHPRLHERAFALAPAADIAPDWVHPELHRTVLQLLTDLRHPD